MLGCRFRQGAYGGRPLPASFRLIAHGYGIDIFRPGSAAKSDRIFLCRLGIIPDSDTVRCSRCSTDPAMKRGVRHTRQQASCDGKGAQKRADGHALLFRSCSPVFPAASGDFRNYHIAVFHPAPDDFVNLIHNFLLLHKKISAL